MPLHASVSDILAPNPAPSSPRPCLMMQALRLRAVLQRESSEHSEVVDGLHRAHVALRSEVDAKSRLERQLQDAESALANERRTRRALEGRVEALEREHDDHASNRPQRAEGPSQKEHGPPERLAKHVLQFASRLGGSLGGMCVVRSPVSGVERG